MDFLFLQHNSIKLDLNLQPRALPGSVGQYSPIVIPGALATSQYALCAVAVGGREGKHVWCLLNGGWGLHCQLLPLSSTDGTVSDIRKSQMRNWPNYHLKTLTLTPN